MLPEGSVAPDFTLPTHTGGSVRLSDRRGKKHVVLAFHPLAFTPVCTVQMQTYERERARLEALDVEVMAVSVDAGPAKKAWADALGGVSYELLSDFHPRGDVAKAFGVLREDGLSERAIFVIDKAGVVRWTRQYEIPEQPDIADLFQALDQVASAPSVTPRGEPTGIVSPEVHADRRVTIRLLAPAATRVQLAGDLVLSGDRLELQKSDAGVWTATIGPLEPDLYAYRFEVDGLSIADPANPYVKTASGPGMESLVDVAADAPAFHDVRLVPHGDLRRLLYHSKSLGVTRAAWVYTPPEYATSELRYPVLYLLHGLGDVENGWTTAGRATEIFDNLLADRQAVPMVVVMPLGHPRPALGTGGGEAWQEPPRLSGSERAIEGDLIRDLLPLVERTFRVSKRSADRAIAGLSMGGLQALTIGLSRLDVFPWVAAMSAAVGVDGDNPAEPFQAALADPKILNSKLKLLWVACGRSDVLLPGNQRLADALRALGVAHVWKVTDGGHSWRVWRRCLAELAPMLFSHGKR